MSKALTRWKRRNPEGTVRFHAPRPRLIPVATVFVFLIGAAASGCAHPQAKTVAGGVDVPLDVPEPPPRATEPITADALPAVGPPLNEPARTDAARPARPPAPAAPAPRPDTPAADAPRPADDSSARPPVTLPAATLQTTPAQQEPEVEARIQSVLARAVSDLSRVDYGRLNTAGKGQYDQAKRFVSQSQEAIRSRNLVFAGTLADKAAELAAQLAGR